jgi:hypothetical protein
VRLWSFVELLCGHGRCRVRGCANASIGVTTFGGHTRLARAGGDQRERGENGDDGLSAKAPSVAYYNDTSRAAMNAAADRQRAGDGLWEYYSKQETRAPMWMLDGDAEKAAALTGLSASDLAGGGANLDVVQRVDGIAPTAPPDGPSPRCPTTDSISFVCTPKSVSLARAVGGDDALSKAIAGAHRVAVSVDARVWWTSG